MVLLGYAINHWTSPFNIGQHYIIIFGES